MKYIKYLFLAVICGCFMASCSETEDPEYTELTILAKPNMLSRVIDWDDITVDMQQNIDYLTSHVFVVNDLKDMPDCKLLDDFLAEEGSVDLTNRSLIVSYIDVEGYNVYKQDYTWVYESTQQYYFFDVCSYVNIPSVSWETKKYHCFVRSAILVDRIPSTAKVSVYNWATTEDSK